MKHPAAPLRFSDTQPGIQHYRYKDNNFNVSSLYEFYKPVMARGFAIKFVTQGEERYTVDKHIYQVDAGSYLLLSGDRDIKVEIESKKNVNGICINIHNTIMEAALASYQTPDSPQPDQELAAFFTRIIFSKTSTGSAILTWAADCNNSAETCRHPFLV